MSIETIQTRRITPQARQRTPSTMPPLWGMQPVPGLTANAQMATGGRSLNRLIERASLRLMRELKLNIPAMGRGISILSALAGEPTLTGEDDAHTADLQAWAKNVRAGWGGKGLGAWLDDHRGQRLWNGYGVAEAQISEGRDEVVGLWSYRSEYFRFWPASTGELAIIQMNAPPGPDLGAAPTIYGGGRQLDNLQACISTFDPEGSGPKGQPLYLACPTIGQVWTETLMAFKSMQRRMGIPVYHVHVELPENFTDDPKWTKTKALVDMISANLMDAVKSQVERGVAKDVFTTGKGKIEIKMLGLEGHEARSFEVDKRTLLEEIVVASDVPPSLFGYAWATTERMSSVQMRKLMGRIGAIRRQDESVIEHMVDLRQRLRGESRKWTMDWPDTNLADLVETSRAALNDSLAEQNKLEYALAMWQAGIWDQLDVALYVTGMPAVKKPMDEPPAVSMQPKGAPANAGQPAGPPSG